MGYATFALNQLTSVDIGDSLTSIEGAAFLGNQLTSIDIPDSVTFIEERAFASNKLTNLDIPDSVTFIGVNAFIENQITRIDIPSSVTTIGQNAFDTNQLTSVVISGSVTSIGTEAFNNNLIETISTDDGNSDKLKDLLGSQYSFNSNSGATTMLKEASSHYADTVQLENTVKFGDNLSFEAISSDRYIFHNASLEWQEYIPEVQWYKDEVALTTQTALTLNLTNIQKTDAGVYHAVVDGVRLPDIKVLVELEIFKLNMDSYVGEVNQNDATITFEIPEEELENSEYTGTITELMANDSEVIFLIDGIEIPRIQGDTISFRTGDRVYVAGGKKYRLVIKPLQEQKTIDKLNIDTYVGVVNQEDTTITFDIPENELVNGKYTGTITELVASDSEVIFLVDGEEYPRKEGDLAAFRTGDSVYVAGGKEYQVIINAIQEQKIISIININTYVGQVNQNDATITFEIPEVELAFGTYIGTITELAASESEIIFFVDGIEYPCKQGDLVAISTGDTVYVAGGKVYQVIIKPIS
jgi:sulfur carrier protein ThiS